MKTCKQTKRRCRVWRHDYMDPWLMIDDWLMMCPAAAIFHRCFRFGECGNLHSPAWLMIDHWWWMRWWYMYVTCGSHDLTHWCLLMMWGWRGRMPEKEVVQRVNRNPSKIICMTVLSGRRHDHDLMHARWMGVRHSHATWCVGQVSVANNHDHNRK